MGEIPFGVKDSELVGFEYKIPEGYEGVIENGVFKLKKVESEDERIIELIRKLLINARNVQSNSSLWKQYDDALAWLEKQKDTENFKEAEEQKNDFVSGQFIQCNVDLPDFKRGEHYWLEYIGDDTYVGRSDNILSKKFHITPKTLFTCFTQQLKEAAPYRDMQKAETQEALFTEKPSDTQIIDALIHYLSEQDGVLTGINCIRTQDIIAYLEKQKEQKFADETMEEKDRIDSAFTKMMQKEQKPLEESIKEICKPINDVAAYLDEQLQRFKKEPSAEEYANILADEEVQGLSVGGEHIPAIKELIRRAFRFGVKWGKEKEQKPAEWSEEDENVYESIQTILLAEARFVEERKWFDSIKARIKSVCWDEKDEKMRDRLIDRLQFITLSTRTDCTSPNITFFDEIRWLKSLRPHWKPSDEDEVRLINTTISFLDDFKKKGYENAVECIDWLKSKLNGNTCK